MSASNPTSPAVLARAALSAGAASASAALAALTPPATAEPPAAASSGAWVEFAGMVQDVWDPELFVLRDGSGRSALLSEAVVEEPPTPDAAGEQLAERLPVYLVDVPGLTTWARAQQAAAPATPAPSASSKRPREVEQAQTPDTDMDTSDGPDVDAATVATPAKRPGLAPAAPAAPAAPTGMGLNAPLRTALGATPAVVAKFYDVASASSLKVHSLVRVVGVLAPAPAAAAAAEASSPFFADEVAARNPAGVPRIHVVRVEPLAGAAQAAPLLRGLPSPPRANVAAAARENLLRLLAAPLAGDKLAAEYVLMNIVSRAATRTDAGGVVGKLSVNAVLPGGAAAAAGAAALLCVLHALLPAVAHVSVTIPVLNAAELYPRKDYDANRLRAAPLQLPAGCTLVADETGMSDGALQERGVRNVRALSAAASRAMVPVDFQFYEGELLFDANVLLLSAGAKSLVPADVVVRVTPESSPSRGAVDDAASLAPAELRDLRLALALLADEGPFAMPPAVCKAVEDTFVAARQSSAVPGGDGSEVLSRWLSVARASARTHGEAELTVERWEAAVALERAREARNLAAAKASGASRVTDRTATATAPLPPRMPLSAPATVPQNRV